MIKERSTRMEKADTTENKEEEDGKEEEEK